MRFPRVVMSQNVIFLFVLLCIFGLYSLTLIRIQTYFQQHQEDSSKVLRLLQQMEIGALGKSHDNHVVLAEPVKPVYVKKEFIFNSQPTKPKKTCKMIKHQYFPLCKEKIEYMTYMWKEPCFRKYGVDGSECSILEYLSKIEPFCMSTYNTQINSDYTYATPRYDLEGILLLMKHKDFEWMRHRVELLWDDWVSAGKNFVKTKQKWKKKKVLAFMGSMSFQPFIFEYAGKGGPLGELIQWTDLIAGLYILGYDVRIAVNETEISYLDRDANGCASNSDEHKVDVLYTDNNGFAIINRNNGFASSAKYRCMYRVLDSFGTFVEFNYPNYPHDIPGGRSGWANQNIIPTQIVTLYPHTQDNSFLGFVVGSSKINQLPSFHKKNKALLYAKVSTYVSSQELQNYLKIISEYFEIHATAVGGLPSYVKNHGSVSTEKVKELLQESKLFIGVGFPYEGPGPMEAMAAGTVYLQPKFDSPKSKTNDKFFDGKPTLRKLTSQNPYMEDFVGEPYCYTIDIKDETLLRRTLKLIKDMEPLPPKIPKEFTNDGMLERIHIFTEHMDYCNPSAPRWPPIHKLQVVVSTLGESCRDVCVNRGLACERTFFSDINDQENIEKYTNITCLSVKDSMQLHPPSYDPASKICFTQRHGQLFSCMHEDLNYRRLCPCRDYEKEQVSICHDCL